MTKLLPRKPNVDRGEAEVDTGFRGVTISHFTLSCTQYYIILSVNWIHRLHNVWFQNNLGQVNILVCLSYSVYSNAHTTPVRKSYFRRQTRDKLSSEILTWVFSSVSLKHDLFLSNRFDLHSLHKWSQIKLEIKIFCIAMIHIRISDLALIFKPYILNIFHFLLIIKHSIWNTKMHHLSNQTNI